MLFEQGIHKLATYILTRTTFWDDVPEELHKYLPCILYMGFLGIKYDHTFTELPSYLSMWREEDRLSVYLTYKCSDGTIRHSNFSMYVDLLRNNQYKIWVYDIRTCNRKSFRAQRDPALKQLCKQWLHTSL